ncbi:hypothetical protein HN011_006260 [Eciton burchellii]|nr:hypothetical protein HN011_006260 [Eciton burchellii]
MTSLELVIARVGLKTKTPSADASTVSMQSSNSTTMPLPDTRVPSIDSLDSDMEPSTMIVGDRASRGVCGSLRNARLSSLEFPRLKFSRAEFSRNLVPRNLRIRRHNGRAGNNSKSQRFRLFWLTGTKLTDTRAPGQGAYGIGKGTMKADRPTKESVHYKRAVKQR